MPSCNNLTREIGRNAALVSNFLPNASDPQFLGEPSDFCAQQESQFWASFHFQSDSDKSQDDLEASTEWKFEVHGEGPGSEGEGEGDGGF